MIREVERNRRVVLFLDSGKFRRLQHRGIGAPPVVAS